MYPTPTSICEEGEKQSHWWREQSLEVSCRGGRDQGQRVRIETAGRNAVDSREDVSNTNTKGIGRTWHTIR